MSPSLAVRRHSPDSAGLQTLDLIFAVCVHVLIVAITLILGLWHKPVEFHPQSVQVSIISAQQLKKLQRRAHPPAKPKKKKISKPRVRPKTKAKRPALKAPQPKAKVQPRVDPDFDPFKPMASSSDVKSSSPHQSRKAADVFSGQLSEQEINRYIAMIQNAVQGHWKVPNVGRDVRDPLVEMALNPGGSVLRVRVIESSGNAALDASLVRAIQAASPFQVPAKQFELFRHNKIRFRPLR